LPPFHAPAARRALAGWTRHNPAADGNAASRASDWQGKRRRWRSALGMTAVSLGVILRTVITG